MADTKVKIYVFDTSAFIRINRFYPPTIVSDLWENLELLLKSGSIISHEYVLNEIKPKGTSKPDFLARWISDKTGIFKGITVRQTDFVKEILNEFPGLIDYKKEKDEADPWVIALAKEEIEEPGLFGKEVIVVSEESISSSQKIPAVCKHFKIPHMSLFEFFSERKWMFRLEEDMDGKKEN